MFNESNIIVLLNKLIVFIFVVLIPIYSVAFDYFSVKLHTNEVISLKQLRNRLI